MKVDGVPIKILKEAMDQSKVARISIIEKNRKEIPKPRAEISPNAPKFLLWKSK